MFLSFATLGPVQAPSLVLCSSTMHNFLKFNTAFWMKWNVCKICLKNKHQLPTLSFVSFPPQLWHGDSCPCQIDSIASYMVLLRHLSELVPLPPRRSPPPPPSLLLPPTFRCWPGPSFIEFRLTGFGNFFFLPQWNPLPFLHALLILSHITVDIGSGFHPRRLGCTYGDRRRRARR